MKIRLYGIPNCDTVKKARIWLEQHELDHEFHDFKKLGLDATRLQSWCDTFGFEQVLNRRGTTWRKLTAAEQAGVDESKAIALMQKHTSLIRRPVLESGRIMLIGFRPDQWQTLL